MLTHHLRRWPNFGSTTRVRWLSLQKGDVHPMLGRRWANIDPASGERLVFSGAGVNSLY